MKKFNDLKNRLSSILVLLAIVGLSSNSFAQWQTSGSDVYYNSGNVGIGMLPSQILEVSHNSPSMDNDGLRIWNYCSTNRNTLTLANDLPVPDNRYIQLGIHGSTFSGYLLDYERKNSCYLRSTISPLLIYTNQSYPLVFGVNGSRVAEFTTDGNLEIVNNNNGIILTSPDGSKWKVTVDNSGNLSVAATTKVLEIENENDINVYPNPTENKMTIDLKTNEIQNISAELYDITGKIVYMKSCKTNSIILDLNDFESGTYILKVKNSDGKIIKTEKIVKK